MLIKTEYFTQHGLPLNGLGKAVICKQIGTIIDKLFKTEKVLFICNFTAPLFAVEPLY
jgi:hypothetical protein